MIRSSGTAWSLSTASRWPRHLAEHAEHVEHRLVDAVGGQRAKAGEIRLIFEFERPSEGAFEIHAVPAGQIVLAGEAGGRVAGVQRAVAIVVLRIHLAAQRAAVRVGFADDDRRVLESPGYEAMMRNPVVDRAQLIGDAHADVAVDDAGRALGVERDEIERRAFFAGGVVRAAQAVLEKVAREAAARRRYRARRPWRRAARAARRQSRNRAA